MKYLSILWVVCSRILAPFKTCFRNWSSCDWLSASPVTFINGTLVMSFSLSFRKFAWKFAFDSLNCRTFPNMSPLKVIGAALASASISLMYRWASARSLLKRNVIRWKKFWILNRAEDLPYPRCQASSLLCRFNYFERMKRGLNFFKQSFEVVFKYFILFRRRHVVQLACMKVSAFGKLVY